MLGQAETHKLHAMHFVANFSALNAPGGHIGRSPLNFGKSSLCFFPIAAPVPTAAAVVMKPVKKARFDKSVFGAEDCFGGCFLKNPTPLTGQTARHFKQRTHRSLSNVSFFASMQPDGQTVEHLPHRMQESEKRSLNRPIFETAPNNVPTGQRDVQKKRCFQTTRMLSTIKTPAPAIKAGFFKKEREVRK